VLITGLVAAAAASPDAAWFEYDLRREVRGTSGAYRGYTDELSATGRYELAPRGDEVAVTADYRWRFSSSEGKHEDGREARTVAFDPRTRRYRPGGVDLDDPEYAAVPSETLAPWMWFAGPSGPTRVLDLDCVAAEDDDVPLRPGRPAWKVACEGTGERHDDYGDLTHRFTDTFWFDRVTGYVLAERYEEHDVGLVDGLRGGFVLTSTLDVTTSSYAPPSVPAPPSAPAPRSGPSWLATLVGVGMQLGGFGVTGVVVLGFVALLSRAQAPPSTLRSPTFGEVRVLPLTEPLVLSTLAPGRCTERFAPFLEELARRALAAGDPVWIAVAGSELAGFATFDRTARVGTILGPDPAVTSNLARRFPGGSGDFFSEHRHEGPAGLQFNVHEDWKVLRRTSTAELPYDRSVVRRYRDDDRTAVLALLQLVWQLDASRWLDVQLAGGDLAYVAVVDGSVVGFALAQAVGADGRFHLNVVHPAHRDRGLGGELVRARLTGLHHLGVERVLVEVASWNVASLHLLRRNGFEDAGPLYVQSSRRVRRQPGAIVRR
jgi:ribosomal protein S18 acetylase RimI-like enzyme